MCQWQTCGRDCGLVPGISQIGRLLGPHQRGGLGLLDTDLSIGCDLVGVLLDFTFVAGL